MRWGANGCNFLCSEISKVGKGRSGLPLQLKSGGLGVRHPAPGPDACYALQLKTSPETSALATAGTGPGRKDATDAWTTKAVIVLAPGTAE